MSLKCVSSAGTGGVGVRCLFKKVYQLESCIYTANTASCQHTTNNYNYCADRGAHDMSILVGIPIEHSQLPFPQVSSLREV